MYTKQRKRIGVTLGLLTFLILAGWLGWRIAPVAAANAGTLGTKVVDIDPQSRMQPVVITKLTIGDQLIQPGARSVLHEDKAGTPFQADEDWLKNMDIYLKNRTDRMIVRAEIMLYFPDTGDGSTARPITQYTITLGQIPEVNLYNIRGVKLSPEPDKQPLLFAPGQALVIHVGDYLPAIKSTLATLGTVMPFSQITRLYIKRFQFYFVDGMRWDGNGYATPPPNHSGPYSYLGAKFFPGNPALNWPRDWHENMPPQ